MTQQCVDDTLGDALGTLATEYIPGDFMSLYLGLNQFLTPHQKMTACPGEFNLFDSDAHQCVDNYGPTKIYHYLPLIPRLGHMYGVPEIAHMLQMHGNEASNTILDIHGSPVWQELLGTDGKFQQNKRATALEFSADGFPPFHHFMSAPYSIKQQVYSAQSTTRYEDKALICVPPWTYSR